MSRIELLGIQRGLEEVVLLQYLHSFSNYFDHPYLPEQIFPEHLRGNASNGRPRFLNHLHQEIAVVSETKMPQHEKAGEEKGAPLTSSPKDTEPKTLVTKETFPAEDWFKNPKNKRGFFIAGPGYGKSILLRTEAYRSAQKAISLLRKGATAHEVHIPILVNFAEVLRVDTHRSENREEEGGKLSLREGIELNQTERFQSALLQAALTNFTAGQTRNVLHSLLHQAVENGNATVLLDSWDEADQAGRNGLIPLCKSWLRDRATHQDLRIFASSREKQHYHIRGIMTVIKLNGFSPESIPAFTAAWRGSESLRINEYIEKDPAISEMARIPLLLAFICRLSENPAFHYRSKTDLISAVFYGLIHEWISDEKQKRLLKEYPEFVEIDDLERWLTFLSAAAFRIFQTSDEIGRRISWKDAILDKFSAYYQCSRLEIEQKAERFLAYWGEEGCGLFVGRAPLATFHYNLFEYLVARHIADAYEETEQQIKTEIQGRGRSFIALDFFMDKKSWDPNWHNILIMVAGVLRHRNVSAPFLKAWAFGIDDQARTRLALACEAQQEYSGEIGKQSDVGRALDDYWQEEVSKGVYQLR